METYTDVREVVRYEGARAVLEAVRDVARALYPDHDTASDKCLALLLSVLADGA